MHDIQTTMRTEKRSAVRSVVMGVATTAAESTLSGMGLLLISYGSYGIFHAIVSSALFYFVLGLMLVLNFSQAIRRECLRRMPPVAAKYLYSASLLDLAVDASAMVHAAVHAVAALGVSSLLRREDMTRLSRALPPEYAYLARPGLLHLLPLALQSMLAAEQEPAVHGGGGTRERAAGEPEGEEDGDELYSSDEEGEAGGQNQRQEADGDGGGDDDDDEGFFAFPRVPRAMRPAAMARAPAAVRSASASATALVARPAGPNFALLEATARQLGAEYAMRWAAQVQSLALSGMHYVASGGGFSTEQLLGVATAFTAAGTGCLLVHRRSGPPSSALTRTLDMAAPILFGVATTVGGMLAVRTCGGAVAALWREGLAPVRRRLNALWRMRGLRGQALGVAVALSTLLMLVAFRMRAQLRQLRWLAAVLVQRLRSGSAQAWSLLAED